MANKIQVKRGLKASIPALNVGEPGFTTDTKEFYIGSASGNVQLAKQADLSAHMADLANRGLTANSKLISDANLALRNGRYVTITNSPTANYYYLDVVTDDIGYNVTQYAIAIENASVQYRRNRLDGTWGEWTKILTSAHEADTAAHIKRLSSTLTLYVTKAGNDTTGDGTSSYPYFTIQKAIDIAGTYYNNKNNIYIKIGAGTYNEQLFISGFGGIFELHSLSGENDVIISGAPRLVSLYFNQSIFFRRLTFRVPSATTGHTIYINCTRHFEIDSCIISNTSGNVVTGNHGVYVTAGSTGLVVSTQMNTLDNAFHVSQYGGRLITANLSGTGNNIVYYVYAGIIQRAGTTPTGTTLEGKGGGGQIFS